MEGENIGDWLYILFLAIAGISSMFSSKKKKKQQQVAAPSPFLAAEKVTDKQSPAGNRLVVPSTEEEIPLTDIEFDNAAELRKAVIYTEILNRKY